ncbi:TPA: uracil-DNA glycosylase [bacterium]|nr:uracil-DNA glycosylase [bacterium]
MVEKIQCYKCKHYKVTWDTGFPYACKAFNFKSSKSPSLVVHEASGQLCQFFSPRPPRKRV